MGDTWIQQETDLYHCTFTFTMLDSQNLDLDLN